MLIVTKYNVWMLSVQMIECIYAYADWDFSRFTEEYGNTYMKGYTKLSTEKPFIVYKAGKARLHAFLNCGMTECSQS